jgi:hypothetical protein
MIERKEGRNCVQGSEVHIDACVRTVNPKLKDIVLG